VWRTEIKCLVDRVSEEERSLLHHGHAREVFLCRVGSDGEHCHASVLYLVTIRYDSIEGNGNGGRQ
jgi:hypothetical protein